MSVELWNCCAARIPGAKVRSEKAMKTYEKKVVLLNTEGIAYRLTTFVWVKQYIFRPKIQVCVK